MRQELPCRAAISTRGKHDIYGRGGGIPYLIALDLPPSLSSTLCRKMIVKIDVLRLLPELISGDLKEQWAALYATCPWATALQSWQFVGTWYEVYRSQFAPLVVVGRDVTGRVVGILPLAISADTNRLVIAGSHQAEYHAWLATSDAGDAFIVAALNALQSSFPDQELRFLFLAHNAPTGWLETSGEWRSRCELRPQSRALMRVGDGSSFTHSLRKKSNKSRLKRLERAGEVRFERLTDRAALAAVFDEIISYGTLRIAAVHNEPVTRDPLKKEFYLAMMDAPGLVHATALRVGDHIAAAHVGLYSRDTVLLGIITHSPFFAEHSPGKLLLLMLGAELAEQGVPIFDLTPGGEYKERFATHHDEVHVLTVFFNRRRYLRYKAERQVISAGKQILESVGMSRARAFGLFAAARDGWQRTPMASVPGKLAGRVRRLVRHTAEFRVYEMDAERIADLPRPSAMKRDDIDDILAYQPAEAWQLVVGAFMREALARLQEGCHIYTHVRDGKLLHYGWLIERQEKSTLTEVGQDYYPPPDAALLFDYYSRPEARGKGLYRASLCQMLHDAALIPGTRRVLIAVLADNGPSRHTIEKIGFSYLYSFFKKTGFGRIERWSTAPQEVTAPRRSSERVRPTGDV